MSRVLRVVRRIAQSVSVLIGMTLGLYGITMAGDGHPGAGFVIGTIGAVVFVLAIPLILEYM